MNTVEHPQNSVYLFPIFYTPTLLHMARKIHYLEFENEKHSRLGIISPSFSMLNFHFHTRSKKCVFIIAHTSSKPVTHTAVFLRFDNAMRMQHETSKIERKIAIQKYFQRIFLLFIEENFF